MPAFLLGSTVVLTVLAAVEALPGVGSSSSVASAPTGSSYPSGFDMKTSWGNLSPFKDADGFGLPKGVPRGCELSQTHVLHRHAQRYPTDSLMDAGSMEQFSQKLDNYTSSHANQIGTGPLAFLDRWKYLMGEEVLLTSGASTEDSSGAHFWAKYGRLLYRAGRDVPNWDPSLNVFPNGTSRPKPVFRTTSQSRILESARWWLSGFFGNIGGNGSYSQYDLVIIPEVDPFNNTLASYDACPGDEDEGEKAKEVMLPKLTGNAHARLSKFLPSDFNLTSLDVLAMMNLCPYEYAALGSSSFCSLFTEQEWTDYEYFIDVGFYGDYGFGSPSGRAQGIGYVEELAARLKKKLIYTSDSSINCTYDNNLAQFPLHQPLYMDMSHDDIIISVLTALGLDYFRYGPNGLPARENAPGRTFHLGEMTPFGAHLSSEIWTCPLDTSFDSLDQVLYTNPDLSSTKDTKDYIRFVLNNAPVPLSGNPGCGGGTNGFCAVDKFLSGIPKLKEEAMYQYACFGNYSTNGQVGNGHPE